MISVEKRERIRRAYFGEEKSIRQIARELSCSRRTIREAIASAERASYMLSEPRPAALLDRLTHKAHIPEFTGESFRFRQRMERQASDRSPQ